ncbi:MAG: hypothetical protein LLG20_04100 [Acidobacteriales bacterium]|nr:hypothetical protein [Terriglobales bacterium]
MSMRIGTITLMLVYEPTASTQGPIPLARVDDSGLTLQVAESAIAAAEARALELSQADEFLGEAEHAEAQRLRRVLALLIPGVNPCERRAPDTVQ